jgi:hypothetical protein
MVCGGGAALQSTTQSKNLKNLVFYRKENSKGFT